MKNITIWNDNNLTDNYKLGFDVENDKAPEYLRLTEKDDDKNNAPIKWFFDIISKAYVDDADTFLLNLINALGLRVDDLEIDVDDLDERVSELEVNDVDQDDRLSAIEDKNTEQDTRLDAIDGLNGDQSGRLSDIEEVNENQDTRLTNLESDVDTIKSNITEIETRIELDFCELLEATRTHPLPEFPNGLYRVGANLRVVIGLAEYPIPVMGLMVVNTVAGVKETYFNMTKSDLSATEFADVNVSYFDGNVDLNVMTRRDAVAEFPDIPLTDFTFQKIEVGGSPSGDFVQRTGDSMEGNLDMQGNDILNIEVDNPLE